MTVFEPSLSALALALLIDWAWGDPADAWHPVAWLGSAASLLLRFAPRGRPAAELLFGATLACALPALAAFAGAALLRQAHVSWLLELCVTTFLLKSTFALRALGSAAAAVQSALGEGRLEHARHALRSLCSRDAFELDEPSIVAATIESLAENASDSFVAPLFYYILFGLPGALLYRAVNTLDAMIGYRGRFEYLGKVAARLDDLLNLIPARLTAALLLAAGALSGKDSLRGLRMLWRDAGNTASPNAGRPMAAMAGLLGVQLEKRGDYSLGDPALPLALGSIDEAWRVVTRSAALTVAATAASIAARGAYLG